MTDVPCIALINLSVAFGISHLSLWKRLSLAEFISPKFAIFANSPDSPTRTSRYERNARSMSQGPNHSRAKRDSSLSSAYGGGGICKSGPLAAPAPSAWVRQARTKVAPIQ